MDRRRADGAAALWRRVRWANVGRLAVLLAAVFLIVSGGRGCRSSSPPPLPAPVGPLRVEEPQRPPIGHSEGRPKKPHKKTAPPRSRQGKPDARLPRRRRSRPGPRKGRAHREERARAAPATPVEPVEPVVSPVPPAPPSTPSGPATPPPRARTGEFTPDSGA